ncbi:hypothetical protein [Lutibacter sp.]|uniref:hypothetical protein n=1 Tax=Lutibacter sp. TaxID=1925666 RepID=UPI0025BF8E55|nr:hypothetical protein [Lutibacter sp.]MCF6181068.1 hypothetical protein [Lutibacter sp.]
MKKQFLNLGKTLSKAEQKQINGGEYQLECTDECSSDSECYMGQTCKSRYCAENPWSYCG